MKTIFFLIFTFAFCQISMSQNLALEEVIQLSSSPASNVVKQLQDQFWKLKYSSVFSGRRTYVFERPVMHKRTDQYLMVTNKGKFNTVVYTVGDKVWFDSVQIRAVKQGFKPLFVKQYKTGKEDVFFKDSSIVLYFNTSGDTTKSTVSYEIAVTEFSSWITGFMPQNTKRRWSEAERYAFIRKCVGNKNSPTQFKDMISGCSCGGAILEVNNKSSTILKLDRKELIDLISECFKKLDVEPY